MQFASISRYRRGLTLATVLALFISIVLLAQVAQADVTPTPFGGTTDTKPGGHGDLTVGADFAFSNADEDIRRVVVDTPTGGVGNPNAIPYAERCPKDLFASGECPISSRIGDVKLTATISGSDIPLTGTISILQTTPEVPTEVGAYIPPPIPGFTEAIRAYAEFYPVTSGPDGDLRIRSVTKPFPRTTKVLGVEQQIQIKKYAQILVGHVANGNAFITNPTRCDKWFSYGYAEAYDSHSNADADPLMTGTATFKKTEPFPTDPDCSTLAPFNTTATAGVSSGARASSPTFTTTVEIPGIGADPQSPAIPKSIVATLPKALNVDVQQLGRICSNDQFAARACPASTQVGAVNIETPMIVDGLQGEAYLTQASPGGTLPDLGIMVHGAINFTMRGINHYVNVSQLQSTFDNIPQVGFSKFSLSIAGGSNGLLKSLKCPKGNKTPVDGGPVSFEMTSYQGQVIRTASPVNFAGCYKVTIKKPKRCMRPKMKLSTTYASRSRLRKVKVWVRGMRAKTITKSPYRVNHKFGKKVKKSKKIKYTLRAYYKPDATHKKGKVVKKSGTFKRCR